MSNITFVTTCKGRLHHIKKTLPLLLKQRPDEVVLVDYGCPDGVGEWVASNFPEVKVIKVDDDPGFCISRARNIGAASANCNWLCFIDADILVSDKWLSWLRGNLRSGAYYLAMRTAGSRDFGVTGTVVCSRDAFQAIGGYDEVIRKYGEEDIDMYARLDRTGLSRRYFPVDGLSSIPHGDDERVTFQEDSDRYSQNELNKAYLAVRNCLSEYLSLPLLFLGREQIMRSLERFPVFRPGKNIDICFDLELPGGSYLSVRCRKRRRYWLFGPREFFVFARGKNNQP